MTRSKFLSLNLKIKTDESRRTLNEYLVSISVQRCVLPQAFHSSSLRELSTKGSVGEHPRINPARGTQNSSLDHQFAYSKLVFVCQDTDLMGMHNITSLVQWSDQNTVGYPPTLLKYVE